MFKPLTSLYSYKFPKVIAYMLQVSEYDLWNYFKWLNRTKDFSQIIKRKQLVYTSKSKLIYGFLVIVFILQILFGLTLIYFGLFQHLSGGIYFGLATLISYPIIWPYLLILGLMIVKLLIINPQIKSNNLLAKKKFQEFSGIKIAVLGSYGKTTMKELLLTVLSAGKSVQATPGNQNVASSHYKFSKLIKGNEDILIIEYGEGRKKDIIRFAHITQPTHAIITGLAPVHQDHYKNLDQQADDLISIKKFVPEDQIFANADSLELKPYILNNLKTYSYQQVMGWKIIDIKSQINGLSFKMTKNNQILTLKSQLIGRHLIGSLALVVALADRFGLDQKTIEQAVSQTKPFEHRMEPYELNGATIIDDTYNGNLEGVRAGLVLLKELKFKRKIYVTPGLVDQGKKSHEIHFLIGRLIARAQPDRVILMNNSTTPFIREGLIKEFFKGEIMIEKEPLKFYQNLNLMVTKGDLVLLQNDWPDNYS